MNDLPIFTCEAGLASLILREIPYRREAYVLVRGVFTSLEALLRQCAAFCRDAGAERVYASGEGDFSGLPLYTHLLTRTLERAALGASDLSVREATNLDDWAQDYNRAFAAVPLAKTCDEAERRELAQNRQAVYVFDGDTPVGLGRVLEDEVLCVAALQKGAGAAVFRALAAQICAPRVRVTVAQTNAPAMRLYDRLGFDEGTVRSSFYFVK